jgi:DNA polymerase-3 subunit alpha
LADLPHKTEVLMGGMLAAIKFSHTKNAQPGKPTKYAMWDLEDLDGIVRCILWPDAFAEHGEMVKADAIVGVRGTIDRRPGAEETNLIVLELIPLDALSTRFTSGAIIRVREDEHGEEKLDTLREILRGYPGTKPLKLRLELADGGSISFICPKHCIEIDPELRRRVDELLGPGNFRLMASPPRPTTTISANGRRLAGARS